MKQGPGITKAVMWCGTAATLIVIILWIVQAWRGVVWMSSSGLVVGSTDGLVGGGYVSPPPIQVGWNFEPMHRFNWWIFIEYGTDLRIVAIPLWMLLAMSLGVTGVAWRRWWVAVRSARKGLCRKCGYDRRGLDVSAVCPECGVTGSTEPRE